MKLYTRLNLDNVKVIATAFYKDLIIKLNDNEIKSGKESKPII